MKKKSTNYQNKKRKIAPRLKKGDKIYLLIKNWKIRKKSKKFDNIKVGLFFIKAKKETISYKLKLPKDIKIYFVFYLLLLELAGLKISLQDIFYNQV